MWWDKTAEAIEQNQAENELLQEAGVQLQHLKVTRIFSSWREHVSFSMAQRQSKEKAQLHHNRAILVKCFTAWFEYRRLRLRKTLLQRQGVWFEHTRLLSLAYSKWRVQVCVYIYSHDKKLLGMEFFNLVYS